MDEIKAKQQAKEEVTKKCINIKEEIIEQIEQSKIVEKVRILFFQITIIINKCLLFSH